jgi:hypothetical protein
MLQNKLEEIEKLIIEYNSESDIFDKLILEKTIEKMGCVGNTQTVGNIEFIGNTQPVGNTKFIESNCHNCNLGFNNVVNPDPDVNIKFNGKTGFIQSIIYDISASTCIIS